jgi:hypothetical protein
MCRCAQGCCLQPVSPNAYAGAGVIPITASLRTKCQQTADSHRLSAKGKHVSSHFIQSAECLVPSGSLRPVSVHHWRTLHSAITLCVHSDGPTDSRRPHINLGYSSKLENMSAVIHTRAVMQCLVPQACPAACFSRINWRCILQITRACRSGTTDSRQL